MTVDLVGVDAQSLISRYPGGEQTRVFRLIHLLEKDSVRLFVDTTLRHGQKLVEEPDKDRIWVLAHARLVLDRIAETFGARAIRNDVQDNVTVQGVPMEDAVDHPKYYNAHPSGVECITIVEHFNFNIGNAIKYLWRADEKANSLEDLKKAEWYVAREIERRIAEGKPRV